MLLSHAHSWTMAIYIRLGCVIALSKGIKTGSGLTGYSRCGRAYGLGVGIVRCGSMLAGSAFRAQVKTRLDHLGELTNEA